MRATSGGRIDRERSYAFDFNGRSYRGHPGDTLASALLANDVKLVGRSLKYHRPRGIVSAGVEEPNAIVQLIGADDVPNERATTLALRDGLAARSLNCWPSVDLDLGAVNAGLSRLFPAGFYYKTFFGAPGGWDWFAPLIRRMAGLGHAPRGAGPDGYEKRFHHCDLLVVGAGPCGLAAALVAASAGVRVTLVDERCEPGGGLLEQVASIDGRPALDWVESTVRSLREAGALVLTDATAFGYYDHNLVGVVEGDPAPGWLVERLWKIRAARVVLATGSMERPLVFPDHDRPGVMTTHGARAYLHRFAVRAGRRAVVVTNNNSAYEAAAELCAGGVRVIAIADVRESVTPSLREWVASFGVEVMTGHGLAGVDGRRSVRAARVAPLGSPHRGRTLACDLVLSSGGWNPTVHLHSQSGARPVYDPGNACFVPGDPVQAERTVGAAAATFSLSGCLAEGARVGRAVADELGHRPGKAAVPEASDTAPLAIEACWEIAGASRRAKAFVDLQNDVTTADLRLAHREGYGAVEHLKRYTTAGMGTDQGKLGNANVIGILAGIESTEPGAVGTTTFRPPYTPVSFGAIAGNDLRELIIPARRTAITTWNEERGAVMFEAGAGYRRPSHYPRGGESIREAIDREVRACRGSVGIYDGSPLGKFDLAGPDVVEFLERVYTNQWSDLAPGRCRFGWMLREDGRLLDDGICLRLAEDRFWMHCGTGAADHVHAHLERLLQLEWPGLRVHLVPPTSQWSNICLCGPRAREVLESLDIDVELDRQSLPFMAFAPTRVAGIEARIARVGYTGELSFELSVRAGHGLALWETLLEAGHPMDITPVGSESSLVMRCEKGFVSAGFEGDGIVNPYDAGQGWWVDESKPDFIGKRSLARDRRIGGIRPAVVGLLTDDPTFVPPDGTPLLGGEPGDGRPNVIGYVSQGVHSPTLERSIALAVLDGGNGRMDSTVTVAAVSRRGAATVTRPCFVDPAGVRMRG